LDDERDDIHLELALEGSGVTLQTFQATARELEQALRDIERNLTHKPARIDWRWDDEPIIRAAASGNGVPAETINEIVRQARLGFQKIIEAQGKSVDWPASFGDRAKRAIEKVVKQLDVVDAIRLETSTDASPLFIDQVALKQDFGRRIAPSEIASIDGVLELISVRGRLHITIQEHGTGRRIRCTLPDTLFDRAKNALGRRVVVEGLLHFGSTGEPYALTEITDLWERPAEKRPLEELRGSEPDFTDGLPAEDYVHAIRGQREGGDD
jgi:hypothetical protein